MPENNRNVPATAIAFTNSFQNIAQQDIGRFRQDIDIARDNTETRGGGKNFARMNRSGIWVYGVGNNEVEEFEDVDFCVHPDLMVQGFIAWAQGGGKPAGQRMARIFGERKVVESELPPVGADWTPCIGITFVCLSGSDKGMQFEYTSNAYGARKAFATLLEALASQFERDRGRMFPIIRLGSESYRHSSYGVIWNPVFSVQRWASSDELNAMQLTHDQAGPAPAPAPAAATPPPPPPAAEPRRRGRPPAQPAQPAAAPQPDAPVATSQRRRRAS